MSDLAKAASPIRAACYIRMSTENQRYSPANQSAAIDEYAHRKGFTVVRTYLDEGKSGLTIKGRIGLQTLIADVQCAQTDFEVLLVYDVSRWGRFQDADESAYYEFICRRSGVAVIYCAEQFDNDGSPAAVLIKSFKRAMAGEYSRELSTKTFAGQCRLSALGFRQGGVPGVGLRRLMVDDARVPKVVMNSGQHKSLQTDRVVLVLGPPEEVAVVRRIYSLFLEGRRIRAITKLLNTEHPTMNPGGRWSTCMVRTVLSNEKYLGHNVFNRTSRKLKAAHVIQNAESQWVRADCAFPAIIDEEQFERARLRLISLCPRPTNRKMLEDLAHLHRRLGKVNKRIVDAERGGMVQADTYRKRFGSLDKACELAGIEENPTSGLTPLK